MLPRVTTINSSGALILNSRDVLSRKLHNLTKGRKSRPPITVISRKSNARAEFTLLLTEAVFFTTYNEINLTTSQLTSS